MTKDQSIKYRADYLIPTYNTNIRADIVATFCNGVNWVDVWEIKATPGNEKESMVLSIAQELEYYKNCRALKRKIPGYSIDSNPKKAISELTKLQKRIAKSSFHKEPDEALKKQVIMELNKRRCHTDIDKAIYLERVVR